MSDPESRVAPKRIQRRRIRGWRMPPNARYVGRPTVYGNPWTMTDAYLAGIPEGGRRAWLVARYRSAIETECGIVTADELEQLRGLDLCCWCPLSEPCHADVLLEFANAGADHNRIPEIQP